VSIETAAAPPQQTQGPSPMLRNHRNASRVSFIAFVAEHSDATRNVRLVNPEGDELLIFRSESGRVLGEAAYPAGGMRPTYRVKIAH
jgi:hypothetical protein